MKTILALCADLAWGIQCILLIYAAYNLLISSASFHKPKKRAVFFPQKRFAMLIAARNEETVIANLVESLLAQDYPRELFDVYVIPNNCTDNTAEAARLAGARILTCDTPVTCKGDVLRTAFSRLLAGEKQYDGFCIFDADNLADRGFLRAMNNALCGGAKAAQGRRDSKNPEDTAITGSYAIYYWMFSRFYNHPRSIWSLSAAINGCGFMVSADLIREMGGFHTRTMTEDLEFTTQCLLRDVRVEWVPEAVIYDEAPQKFLPSWKQRKRWSTGLMQCAGLYGLRLLGKALRERDFRALDQFIFLLAPLMQILSILPAAFIITLLLLTPNHNAALFLSEILPIIRSLLLSIAVTTAGAALTVRLERHSFRNLGKAVCSYWIFLLSWIPINILCLFRKSNVWVEIKHTRSVRVTEMTASK